MRSKIIIFLITLALFSCKDKGPEDPLILPPDFNIMPDLQQLDKDSKGEEKETDQDIEELRDLLLEG